MTQPNAHWANPVMASALGGQYPPTPKVRYDPTNSIKALKEVVVLRICFNPTRSRTPCYNTTHACNNTYAKMNLSTVKWAHWDKTHSRKLSGPFICVWIALCTIVAHNIAQNRPDNFPSYPPDNHHCSDNFCLREGGMNLWGPVARVFTGRMPLQLLSQQCKISEGISKHWHQPCRITQWPHPFFICHQ